MTMTIEQAHEMVDLLSEHDVEAQVYEGYSGRGMYGRETVGIVLPDQSAVLLLGFCWGENGYDAGDLPRRFDSMGRGLILY